MSDNLACTIGLLIAAAGGFTGLLVALIAAVSQAVLG